MRSLSAVICLLLISYTALGLDVTVPQSSDSTCDIVINEDGTIASIVRQKTEIIYAIRLRSSNNETGLATYIYRNHKLLNCKIRQQKCGLGTIGDSNYFLMDGKPVGFFNFGDGDPLYQTVLESLKQIGVCK